MRISPESCIHDAPMYDDEFNTFVILAKELSSRGIAYLHINEMDTSQRMLDTIRQVFSGTLILAAEYTREKALRHRSLGGLTDRLRTALHRESGSGWKGSVMTGH